MGLRWIGGLRDVLDDEALSEAEEILLDGRSAAMLNWLNCAARHCDILGGGMVWLWWLPTLNPSSNHSMESSKFCGAKVWRNEEVWLVQRDQRACLCLIAPALMTSRTRRARHQRKCLSFQPPPQPTLPATCNCCCVDSLQLSIFLAAIH